MIIYSDKFNVPETKKKKKTVISISENFIIIILTKINLKTEHMTNERVGHLNIIINIVFMAVVECANYKA